MAQEINIFGKNLIDFTGLSAFWEAVKLYFNNKFTDFSNTFNTALDEKQNVISDLDSIREGSALGATAVQDRLVFAGTRAEYDTAFAAGDIAVGTLVIILDETVANGAAETLAILGTGKLGKLILGKQ